MNLKLLHTLRRGNKEEAEVRDGWWPQTLGHLQGPKEIAKLPCPCSGHSAPTNLQHNIATCVHALLISSEVSFGKEFLSSLLSS